jgi:hypothetical protein
MLEKILPLRFPTSESFRPLEPKSDAFTMQFQSSSHHEICHSTSSYPTTSQIPRLTVRMTCVDDLTGDHHTQLPYREVSSVSHSSRSDIAIHRRTALPVQVWFAPASPHSVGERATPCDLFPETFFYSQRTKLYYHDQHRPD